MPVTSQTFLLTLLLVVVVEEVVVVILYGIRFEVLVLKVFVSAWTAAVPKITGNWSGAHAGIIQRGKRRRHPVEKKKNNNNENKRPRDDIAVTYLNALG